MTNSPQSGGDASRTPDPSKEDSSVWPHEGRRYRRLCYVLLGCQALMLSRVTFASSGTKSGNPLSKLPGLLLFETKTERATANGVLGRENVFGMIRVSWIAITSGQTPRRDSVRNRVGESSVTRRGTFRVNPASEPGRRNRQRSRQD